MLSEWERSTVLRPALGPHKEHVHLHIVLCHLDEFLHEGILLFPAATARARLGQPY